MKLIQSGSGLISALMALVFALFGVTASAQSLNEVLEVRSATTQQGAASQPGEQGFEPAARVLQDRRRTRTLEKTCNLAGRW